MVVATDSVIVMVGFQKLVVFDSEVPASLVIVKDAEESKLKSPWNVKATVILKLLPMVFDMELPNQVAAELPSSRVWLALLTALPELAVNTKVAERKERSVEYPVAVTSNPLPVRLILRSVTTGAPRLMVICRVLVVMAPVWL